MKKFYLPKWGVLTLCLSFSFLSLNAQWKCGIDNTELEGLNDDSVVISRWTPRPNLSIANNEFGGLIEYLPVGYNNSGNNKKYPVIIYFGGRGAQGNGSLEQLCELFSDQETSLPYQFEKGVIPSTVTQDGTTYEFIFIAPTYRSYQYPTNYLKAEEVEGFLDYVEANYRIDPTRIYLTGMSAGANMVINYVSNSVARANRIAAYNTSSLCSSLGREPNTATAYQNIVTANLPGRFFHCEGDRQCADTISQNWTIAINNAKAGLASYTVPSNSCNYNGHNSWTYNYSPTYLVNGSNLYQWFVQFSTNTALPVTIKSFTGTLSKDKVVLDWITSAETSSSSFRIERAGSDYVFTALSSLPAAGNSSTDKAYQFIDPKPLPNLNLYRLVQIDADGSERMSGIVKVMNKNSGKFHLAVSPNPFTTKLTAYLNLEKRQKVNATLTDLNGRKISTQSMILNEGSSEISISTSSLQKGIYLLRIETEQSTQIQKVIRQ
jgi:hypothetical protein